jgi:uncharacterized damage-inducible protein DinB
MAESVQQYMARILDNLGDRDPLDVLRQTAFQMDAVLGRLDETAASWRPAPGKWSIREIVAHLADCELVLGARLRWAAAQPGSGLAAFDQDKWAATARYREIPAAVSAAAFRALREWNLNFVDRLNAEERNGYAIHEERGRQTLADILSLSAGHDINHLKQMEQLAAKAGSGV